MKQPQEIEYWYVLPAIRREMAKILLEQYRFSQKEIAGLLNLTESAVSQYLKGKRGCDIEFDKEIKGMIRKVTKESIKNKGLIIAKINNVLEYIRKNKSLCVVHRKYDKNVPKICKICLGD